MWEEGWVTPEQRQREREEVEERQFGRVWK